ncbi:MAG: GlsB/YeaQ/YmgE family stress response membrane protein [Methylovirgula sp.]
MFMHDIIIWLIIGGLAGWIAGLIVQGTGFGILGDIVVGIVGAIVAGWLLPQLGVHIGTGFVTEVIDAIIGAVILLVVVGLIRRAL